MDVIEITEESREIQLAESDLARVRAMVIQTAENYRDACQVELQLKQSIKDTTAKFENLVKKARETYEEAKDLRSAAVNPRQWALKIVQDLRVAWEQEQENLRQQRQREAQAEVAQKAAKEADELALVLEKAGEKEMAQQVRADVFVPLVNVPKEVPKVQGVSTREVWFFRINKPARIPKAYLAPDEAKIQTVVNAQHKAAEKMIPGIEVWSEQRAWGAAKPK